MGSGTIGGDGLGGGLLTGAVGLIALAGGSQLRRRRAALRPVPVQSGTSGD
jgi:hypothetical protein